MAKLFDKVMDIMKLNDYEDEQDMDLDSDEFNTFTGVPQPVRKEEPRNFKTYTGGKSKVMNLQANIQMEVVVMQPTSYDEAQEICDHIKSKKPCIINLENIEHEIAQRIMDFVSGSCYTLDGNMQRVTNNIFLIAPENVDILGDFQEELKSNGIIRWDK
jgi:cell division inhibitor SepF